MPNDRTFPLGWSMGMLMNGVPTLDLDVVTLMVGNPFSEVSSLAIDRFGNIFVNDSQYSSNRIIKIAPDGVQSDLVAPLSGEGGDGITDGPFGVGGIGTRPYPRPGMTTDDDGNLYVWHQYGGDSRIRKVTPDGVVSTLAGGVSGVYTNDADTHVNGPGATARFGNYVSGIVAVGATLYVLDYNNFRIRAVTLPDGVVSDCAGSGRNQRVNGPVGTGGDTDASFAFGNGSDIAYDPTTGDLIVSEMGSFSDLGRIGPAPDTPSFRRVTPYSYVGSEAITLWPSWPDTPWDTDILRAVYQSLGIAVDRWGTIYVSTYAGIRRLDKKGHLVPFSGYGNYGESVDGSLAWGGTVYPQSVTAKPDSAQYYYPAGMAFDPTGNLWITQAYSSVDNRLREIKARCFSAPLPAVYDVSLVAPVIQQPTVPGLTATRDATIHALVGAQYGDLEFDVGKSVRWTQWFADDVFITDINTGDARYWIVNWTETFPRVFHRVTGINFFAAPTQFRAEQFREALVEPNLTLGDDDWVLFVDAHEGLSCDTRSLPDDVGTNPFQAYVHREITRAETANEDFVSIPFYAFLRHVTTNVTYLSKGGTILTPDVPNPASGEVDQPVAVPYYLPYQGLKRLWKVSALRAPDFDWSQLDQPSPASADVKLQIVSYAYAHWNIQDIVPPATAVEPLSLANDDGFRMRNLISRVRPLTGLSFNPPGTVLASDEVLKHVWEFPGDITTQPSSYPDTSYIVTYYGSQSIGVDDGSGPPFLTWTPDAPIQVVEMVLHAAVNHLTDPYSGSFINATLFLGSYGVYPPMADISIYPNGPSDTSLYPDIPGGISVVATPEWYPLMNTSVEGPLVLYVNAGIRTTDIVQATDLTVTVWYKVSSDWSPSNDVAGDPGPWAFAQPGSPDPYVFPLSTLFPSSSLFPSFLVPTVVPPLTTVETAGILVPLYDLTFRINLRDGIWYTGNNLGNIPLTYDNDTGTWVPRVSPVDWHDTNAYVSQL